jgi:putative ABC transport system permease protein
MSQRSLRLYRLLIRLLPARDRERDAGELETAFLLCVERERARLGWSGVVYAWLQTIRDTAAAAILLRHDARRRRRVAVLTRPPVLEGDSLMTSFWQDVRYSARVLGRAPGFSAVVIVTLGLAIGATSGIFSVVNAVLLRSLPFAEPERLVILYEAIPKAISGPIGFSAPDFVALEQRARSFTAMAAFRNKEFELSGVEQPERVTGARASAALFDVLGVSPTLGRAFSRDEETLRRPVVVLSDGIWRRKFGADPGVLGSAVVLDRQPYTVVGVLPRTFVFPNRGPLLNNIPAELFVPASFTDWELTAFGSMYNNSVVARLRPDVTVAQADAEVRTLAGQLAQEIYPPVLQQLSMALSASAQPLRDETVGRIERVLYVLLAAVAVVLLIACTDITNLMLTRAAARNREMAVRSALGAGRGQLARQVLVESGLLSLVGGALGVVVTCLTSTALVRIAPATIPRLKETSLDLRVLGFALAVSCLTALLCGVLPALELSRRPSGEALKDGGRSATTSLRQRRIFGGLVIAQFALAVVLLVACGLLIRSFTRLMAVSPGFRAERVLTLATSLPASAYGLGTDIRSFYQRLLERVDRLPGVVASAASTDLPLSVRERRAFTLDAQPAASAELPHVVAHDWVLGRYFESMGINLVRGRFISQQDTQQSEPIVVINETMAKRFWPGQDPIDQRLAWGGPNNHSRWMRIVGIVADVKQGPLNTETFSQTYQPWVQLGDQMIAENIVGALRSLKIIVRTDGDPLTTASAVQAQVRALDPSLPVAQVRTMEAVVQESASPQRFNTLLLGGFAAVALMLAALGMGGVLATAVSRRTQEIGVRMALGAQRLDLLRMVIRQGMTLAFVGLAIGVPAAFLLTRFMSGLLFEIGVHDPVTFAGAIAVLVSVATLACYIPARRATKVEPVVALRCE